MENEILVVEMRTSYPHRSPAMQNNRKAGQEKGTWARDARRLEPPRKPISEVKENENEIHAARI